MDTDFFLPQVPENSPTGEPVNGSEPEWGFVNISRESPSNTTVPCRNDYCVTDEEYVDMVMAYIFPTAFEWFLVVTYMVLFVVGLVGNFLVCFAVWRNHSMRTVTNYFIVNLAIADILVVVICLPPTVIGDVTETWYMGSIMCKVVKYLQVGTDFDVMVNPLIFGRLFIL